MLIFLIALQGPAASKNWQHVSRLCERTLRSACQQTHGDFRVVLVCNQRPAGDFTHPALTVIEEDFPTPRDQPERMADKWRKLKRGLIALRHDGPAHVMITDADDCVHRGLAALVASDPSCQGWNFETGYMHDAGSRWLYRLRHFDRHCGTSSIVRLEPAEFPHGDMEAPHDHAFILWNGHGVIGEYLRARGTPLRPMPFIGAIYNSATGENDSGVSLRSWRSRRMLLKKLLHSRPLTRSIRRDFGLYDLPS